GIASGDMTGNPFVEAEPSEQAECGGQSLLAMAPLVLVALERRVLVRLAVGAHTILLSGALRLLLVGGTFENGRHPLASADAHGLESVTGGSPIEFVEQRGQDTTAG